MADQQSQTDNKPHSPEMAMAPEEYRWRLAEHFRRRSDESANYLRTLLFIISSAAVGWIADKHIDKGVSIHIIPSVLLIASIIALIISWNRQKEKSILRVETLEKEGYNAFLAQEKIFSRVLRNSTIDNFAYTLIALGIILEFSASIYLKQACQI